MSSCLSPAYAHFIVYVIAIPLVFRLAFLVLIVLFAVMLCFSISPLSAFLSKALSTCLVPYPSSWHPLLFSISRPCERKAFPVLATHLFSHNIYSTWRSTCCLLVFQLMSDPTLSASSIVPHRVLFMLLVHCTRLTSPSIYTHTVRSFPRPATRDTYNCDSTLYRP